MTPTDGPQVVVVTGASSGIGRATARAFARRGAVLVLTARGEPGLRAAELECRFEGASATHVVVADVLDVGAVTSVAGAALERFGRLDVWVHAAAVVAYGRFEDVPPAVFERVVATAVLGSANSARAALGAFRGQGSGTLVLVGSLLGQVVTPYMGSYVVGKWGVRGLGRLLQVETRDAKDIHVCVVSPGGVDTPIYRQAANYAGRVGRPPPPVDPPEKVARAILSLVDQPRRNVSVGFANGVTRAGFVALPAVFDALVGPLMRAGGLSREPTPAHEGNVFLPRPLPTDGVHGQWGRHWLRGAGAAAGLLTAGGVAVAVARVGRRRTAWGRNSRT